VSVIGIHDKDWARRPKLLWHPRRGFVLTEQDIIDFCRANLSKYKCPRKVTIVNELPKNTIGKIDIKAVKENYKE